jgi:UrcA family protein
MRANAACHNQFPNGGPHQDCRNAAKQVQPGKGRHPSPDEIGRFDMTRITALFAALAATAAMTSFVAHAGEIAPAAPVAQVHYSDLNLASADGARVLKDRVARAAKRVCVDEGDTSLAGAMQARDCMKEALAKAMPQVELALANAGTQFAQNHHVGVSAR